MKILFLCLSIVFFSVFIFLVILYLNLFVIGYTFFDFVYFIIRRGIIFIALVGVLFLFFGMERKR